MIINIRVVTKAKENKVTGAVTGSDVLKVYTTAAPTDGKANEAVIKLLAKHFGVAKSNIKIIRGDTNRDKLIEIL